MSVCLHPRFCYSVHKSQLSVSCYIVIDCLSGLTVFSHIISQTARFSGKKYQTQHACFDFLYKFVSNMPHSENNSTRLRYKFAYVFM
jgi:hypothetical protein